MRFMETAPARVPFSFVRTESHFRDRGGVGRFFG